MIPRYNPVRKQEMNTVSEEKKKKGLFARLREGLSKMRRVIDREYPEADTRCILVLDATTGQNGLMQARAFKEVAEINGIILSKLDGTAKGGIALAIRQELEVPVWYIGVGEGIDDLQPFSAKDFVEALF